MNLQNKVNNATKWSSLTEIAAKIIVPVTNMILARILAPEAFGVLATVIMIMSFADMFSDAGFQKYLIQYDFKSAEEKNRYANVAFWTNLAISIVLFGSIALFSDQIATLVGNPGLGTVIWVASIQLIFTSFSSIQMALYRRDFDFKTLFSVRIIAISIPFIITIPLALLGLGYWSLVIGSIIGQLSNAILLTIKSSWKPTLEYSFDILKKMLSFSSWSLLESVSIWFTVWIDALIIGLLLNQYYLGLFKTSTTMVNSLMAIITAATVPVLFSALSRLQKDDKSFKELFFKSQRLISILVFPLGVGVYLYSDLATGILLGSQWMEASSVIGVWALTSAITIVFGHYCSEVYRAKGRPKLSFLAQILHLIVLVPVILISAKYGFWTLVFVRSWIKLQGVLVHFIIMKVVIGISIFKTIKNVFPTMLATLIMGLLGTYLKDISENIIWQLTSIFICIIFYFGILLTSPKIRQDLIQLNYRLFNSK